MRRRLTATALVAALATAGALGSALPAEAANYTPITGTGSSWAANAIDDWRADVVNKGIKVNFAATGSVAGLTDFSNGTDDFAASDIPYGIEGTSPSPPSRGYAYIPDVAGGTAFMYNLQVGGKRFTNLKLSGETIAGIFSGAITKWNDAKIKADNPGVALPGLQITPVVRSDGSGATAQFTLWLAKQFPSVWKCGELSFFTQCRYYNPTTQKAESGDNGVAGYVSQSGSLGSIGYVEYSYALQSGFPVAKVLNKAGFYVLPNASNVAVALLKAKINMKPGPDYLTQQLDDVYADTDPRTYPVSSYSYFVIPAQLQNGFTTVKGNTLSAFIYYALCDGQQQAPTLGYSPLPINLVQAGFEQVKKIPGAVVRNINIKSCHNPTFSTDGTNTLAKTALYPDRCDKKGETASCVYGTAANGGTSGSTAGQGDNNAHGAGSGGTGRGGGTTGGAGGGTDGGGTGGGAGGGVVVGDGGTAPDDSGDAGAGQGGSGGGVVTIQNPDGKTSCDPDTGECTQLAAVPAEVASYQGSTLSQWVVWIAIAGFLLVIVAPPVVVLANRRGRR